MLALAREAIGDLPVTLVHAAYSEMGRVLEELGIDRVEGVLLDLGLSSDQLAWEGRGFSFAADGPLDMRFDPDAGGPTAADLVNRLSAEELANLIFEFGEERFSRRIARRIVEARQAGAIRTTGQLADLVRRSLPGRARHGPIDPSTRVFQALRIAVNDELGQLDPALRVIPDVLAPAGGSPVISFHSLEDRRVKWAFKTDPRTDRADQETRDRDGPGSGRQPPSAQRQTKGGRAMSELMSNPQTEPEPWSPAPSSPIAEGGPDGLDHPGIAVRYDAVTDLSGPPGDLDDGDVESAAPGPRSGFGEARQPTEALLGAVARSLLSMAWASMRAAYHYPRWALVIACSILILGATALTRPGKPTPRAEISSNTAVVPASGSGGQGAANKDGKESKESTVIANAAPAAPSKPKEESKDKRGGETAVPAPLLERVAVPAPSASKVADAGPTNPTNIEGSPARTDPAPANQESVPAPTLLTTPTSTTLLAASPEGQAPAPAPPTLAPTGPQASPAAPTADAPRPNPEILPAVPSSETHLPPTPAAAVSTPTPAVPVGATAESVPPAPGKDDTLTGGADAGNATLPPGPTRDPGDGSVGSSGQPTIPPGSGPPPQPTAPTPGSPMPETSPATEGPSAPPSGLAAPAPLPPVTAPSGPIEPEPKGPPPKPDQPAPASAPQTGGPQEHPAAHTEVVAPMPPGNKPAAKAETKAIEPTPPGPTDGPKVSESDLPAAAPQPLVKPANPAPGPAEARADQPPEADASKPKLLKAEDLKPGHEGSSAGARRARRAPRQKATCRRRNSSRSRRSPLNRPGRLRPRSPLNRVCRRERLAMRSSEPNPVFRHRNRPARLRSRSGTWRRRVGCESQTKAGSPRTKGITPTHPPRPSGAGRIRRPSIRPKPMLGPRKARPPRQRASGDHSPVPIRLRTHGPTRDGRA